MPDPVGVCHSLYNSELNCSSLCTFTFLLYLPRTDFTPTLARTSTYRGHDLQRPGGWGRVLLF